jgi:hypothetical protein
MKIVVMLLLVLKGILLGRDQFTLLSVAYNRCVACIVKLCLIAKSCVAGGLAFYDAQSMVFGLRATALNRAVSTLASADGFACVTHEDARV